MQDAIRTQSQSVGASGALSAIPQRHVTPLLKLSPLGKWGLFWKMLASSSRRLIHRIRTLQAYRPVDFGPALLRQADGSLQPNERTNVRIQSIDTVLAKYRWADIEDTRIFLEGFDAGEAWSRRTSDR